MESQTVMHSDIMVSRKACLGISIFLYRIFGCRDRIFHTIFSPADFAELGGPFPTAVRRRTVVVPSRNSSSFQSYGRIPAHTCIVCTFDYKPILVRISRSSAQFFELWAEILTPDSQRIGLLPQRNPFSILFFLAPSSSD